MAAFNMRPAATGSVTPTGEVIAVELGDLFIEPAQLTAPAGVPLTFEITNNGRVEHNFAIEGGPASEMIAPGESITLNTGALSAGDYEFICEVGGYAEGGMKGAISVSEESGSSGAMGAAGDPTHGMSGMSAAEMAEVDAAVTKSFPAETKGLGGQPLSFEMVDGVKVFELTADELRWEVEPGEVFDAMGYNGTLPGPQINADLGDRVRIILHNKLDQPTTLHFHGVRVPNAMDGVPVITQDPVMPGESFTYEFTLRNSGTHMYHPHFNATEQITGGLLGAFVVSDPGDPEVAVEQTIVLNDGPLGFTINGKGFPATAPIVLDKGQTLRIRYMNEGLQIHPMHLHGLVPACDRERRLSVELALRRRHSDGRTSASQLRAEFVVIRNSGNRRRQLRNWVVRDQEGHDFRFPRYRIPADGYVKVHTGSGRDRRGDLYWGLDNFVWNNDGDKAVLRYKGATKDTCSYAGGESPNPPKSC